MTNVAPAHLLTLDTDSFPTSAMGNMLYAWPGCREPLRGGRCTMAEGPVGEAELIV